MINYSCPHCGESLEAPESLTGQQLSCPRCGGNTFVHRTTPHALPSTSSSRRRRFYGTAIGFSVGAAILAFASLTYCIIPRLGTLNLLLALAAGVMTIIGFVLALKTKDGIALGISIAAGITAGYSLSIAIFMLDNFPL